MARASTISVALAAAASMMFAGNVMAQDRRGGEKAGEAARPTPIGNPGSWIPADGYPAAAQASAEEGRVGFTLDVDDTGRPSDCKVTTSSGSPLLDDTTCYYMTANARFTPPRDGKGKAISSKWSSSMLWKLQVARPASAPVATPVPVVEGSKR